MRALVALPALVLTLVGCPAAGDPPPGQACGDGIVDESVDSSEACDDGNRWGGDGCDHLCASEDGFGETEPNDDPTEPQTLDESTVFGSLPPGDLDCFAIDVGAAAAVRASVTEPGGCSGDLAIELVNAAGNRVTSGLPDLSGCAAIEPDTDNAARYLEAGPHSLCVSPILGAVVRSYQLTFELLDSCTDLAALPPDASQDLEGDGIADVCDPDDDNDGVDDGVDNCPEAPNGPEQPFPWSTAQDGFVTLWLVLGPFTSGVTPGACEPSPDAFAAAADADAAPVLGDVASELPWFAHFAWPGDSAIVRFTDHFSVDAPREAYVASWVYAPEERSAVLTIGSDDGQIVWLNGAEIGRKLNCSGVAADQLAFPVTLQSGWNRLLHKVYDGGGGWGVIARFYEEDGLTPMTDLGLSIGGAAEWVDDQGDLDGDGVGDICDPTP